MNTRFGKSLLGFKPGQVMYEIQRMESDSQQKIAALQSEIESARAELKKSEERAAELQKRLNEFIDREHMIADVMIKAQKNAQRMEDEARERARTMIEKSEEELRIKLQELEMLRAKVDRFREEFRGLLDEYRISLETMKMPSGETPFTPTLVLRDRAKERV